MWARIALDRSWGALQGVHLPSEYGLVLIFAFGLPWTVSALVGAVRRCWSEARSGCGAQRRSHDAAFGVDKRTRCVIIALPLDGAQALSCGTTKLSFGGALSIMLIFYIDESGDTKPYHDPLLEGETPLFCLSAVALPATAWRSYDRSLFALKRRYFPSEMSRYAVTSGRRPEYYEVKGRHLFRPSHAGSRRSGAFVQGIFDLCQGHGARFFAAIWRKDTQNPGDPQSIYTKSIQILAERFHLHCTSCDDEGIMVVDSRTRGLDLQVATSHLSYMFGHSTGRTLTRVIEAPMFGDSTLSAGLQIADIVGGCLYGVYYHRRCSDVGGLFDGSNAVPPQVYAAAQGPFQVRTPARDYSHCRFYGQLLDELQWRRAQGSHSPLQAHYGYREVT